MAAEAGDLLSAYMARLPDNHRDKPFLDTIQSRLLTYQAAEHAGKPTVETLTAFWRSAWRDWGTKLGRSVSVPELSLRDDAFELLKRDGRTLVFVPEAVAGSDAFASLRALVPPGAQCHWAEPHLLRVVMPSNNQAGWRLSVTRT